MNILVLFWLILKTEQISIILTHPEKLNRLVLFWLILKTEQISTILTNPQNWTD